MQAAFPIPRSKHSNRAHARGAIVRTDRRRRCADSFGKCRSENNSKRRTCTRLGTISKDPIGFAAGDANLYRYVGNQPISRTDPSGKSWLNIIATLAKETGHAILDNGKRVKLINFHFANKSVTLDMLRKAGCRAKNETFEAVADKFGDDIVVHYDDFAQPDFMPFAEYWTDGMQLTGHHPTDVKIFLTKLESELDEDAFKELVENLSDYNLHHHSLDTMVVVDSNLHSLYRHTGSASILRAGGFSGFMFSLASPGLHEIQQGIENDPCNALAISDAEVIGTAAVDVARWFDPFIEDYLKYYTSQEAIDKTWEQQKTYFYGHPGGARP